jgi:hypothetical protein
LDQAITANGGNSLVVACEGSDITGTLISGPQIKGVLTKDKQECVWREYRDCIQAALQWFPVDLIHLHGIDFFEYLPVTTIPKLITLHLPLSWYPTNVFTWPAEANVFLHCVSRSQQRGCPRSGCMLPPIENGVCVPPEPPRVSKADFVLSLGRICPEKGFHIALDAAKLAGIKMVLAGAVFDYETHQRYFEEEILPRLDEHRQFIGPVGKTEKHDLMSKARCLLVPSLVSETSSLVAMEALACGTPVIAYRNGALSEIVQEGCNGFLVENAKEMADAIGMAGSISPGRCWASVRNRFTAEVMVARYLERYRQLMIRCAQRPR